MTISEENRNIIRKFENIMRRGLYASGDQVTQIYNSVLDKNVRTTNCGSCIRSRITELVKALNKVEADEAKLKAQEQAKEDLKAEPENADNRKSPKTKGRKTKQKDLEREEG